MTDYCVYCHSPEVESTYHPLHCGYIVDIPTGGDEASGCRECYSKYKYNIDNYNVWDIGAARMTGADFLNYLSRVGIDYIEIAKWFNDFLDEQYRLTPNMQWTTWTPGE